MKTAECVSPKHPDKMCDQISDAILDHLLKQDPKARVAVETMGGHGKVAIMGEITAHLGITPEEIKSIVHRITGENEEVFINLVEQSPEIAQGVNIDGAGDQGIMVGYACTDNDDMIPHELYLARSLCKFIYEKHPYDGKTQITLDEDQKITSIVASFGKTKAEDLRHLVAEWLGDHQLKTDDYTVYCNPAGDWNQCGFEADTGLTGRKIAVDCYGPQIPIGGGAFSGKDCTKVDRSGAYMARKIARDTMIQFQAKECTVKLAYAIGIPHPVMATAFVTNGQGLTSEHAITGEGRGKYLAPGAIRDFLKLDQPIYEETAKWGHFGNGFNWDK